MIVDEVLDSKIKQGGGGVIFKVDRLKAYDQASWNFLDFVMGRWNLTENGGNGFDYISLMPYFL